jgi:small conductance mechanosensitive channel
MITPRLPALVLAIALSLAASPATGLCAQPAAPAAPAASSDVSTGDLKSLVGTLENDAAREKLVAQLKALIAAREEAARAAPPPSGLGARLISALSAEVEKVSAALASTGAVLFDLPGLYDWARYQVSNGAARAAWLDLVLKLCIVLAFALFAERILEWLLRRPRHAIGDRERDSLWLRFVFLFARTILDLVPIATFGAVAYLVLPFTKPGDLARLVTLAVVNANLLVRGILAIGRALLAPRAATLHLLEVSEETASYWYVWLRRLTWLSIYGYFAAEVALLVGLSPTGYEVLLKLIGLVIAGLVAVLVLQNRGAVARWIRGNAHGGMPLGVQVLRARLADIWHVLALLYIAGIYAVWALHIQGGFNFILRASVLSILVLALARGAAGAGSRLLRRFFAIGADLRQRFPSLEARAGRYLPALDRSLRALVYLAAALLLLQFWGADSFRWLASDLGQHLVGVVAIVAITVLVAVLVWEGVSLAIEYYLARHTNDGRAVQRRARARTVLPLFRRAFAILLVAVVGLIVLSELGINIAPLLAGAGVVGIAIGFGAQTLVKDIITGLDILLADTIAVGDVVTIGGESGVVEAISIRSIQLRDGTGAVHTIPFSEVTKVVNLTKDFSYAVFNIGVSYRTDIDRAIEAVRALGGELKGDPAFGAYILEPLEMSGLDRFGDYAIIISARIKTLPGKQWDVSREFNRRLKHRFDALGIAIPITPHMDYLADGQQSAAPIGAPAR